MFTRGAFSEIDPVIFEADIAGHLQACCRARLLRLSCLCQAKDQT